MSEKISKKMILISLIVLTLSVSVGYAEEQAGSGQENQRFNLSVGYSFRTFLNVDISDARQATKLWTDVIARKNGWTAQASIYTDLPALEKALKTRKIDFAVLVADEYIDLSHKIALDPLAAAADEKGSSEELLVVVRKDSPYSKLIDLRHKILNGVNAQHSPIQMAWIETQLMRSGISRVNDFFGSVHETRKPSQACLPVFFRKADACIVRRSGFDTMAEMNPQLGRELSVIATSPRILGGVVAARKDLSESKKAAVRSLLVSMHRDSQGRQLMMLFGMSKLVPFDSGYLDQLEALLQEQKQLKRRYARMQ